MWRACQTSLKALDRRNVRAIAQGSPPTCNRGGNYLARTLGATTTFENDHNHIFLAWRKDMTNREGNRLPEIAVLDGIFGPVRLNLIQSFLLSRSLRIEALFGYPESPSAYRRFAGIVDG